MNERKLIPVEHHVMDDSTNQKLEYLKLFLVMVAIVVVSTFIYGVNDAQGFEGLNAIEKYLAIFMGVFFVTFAMFKIINIDSFIDGFRMYDLIAKRSKVYAGLYPVLQMFLGVSMFIFASNPIPHFLAAVLSFIALIGVYFKVRAKEKIHCACLGNVIKMPLSTISAIEDGLMFVMALYMFTVMV